MCLSGDTGISHENNENNLISTTFLRIFLRKLIKSLLYSLQCVYLALQYGKIEEDEKYPRFTECSLMRKKGRGWNEQEEEILKLIKSFCRVLIKTNRVRTGFSVIFHDVSVF